MAWNHYYIFVKGPTFDEPDAILSRLNLGAYKPSKEATLSHTNKPTTLFAGIYQGNLLIVHQQIMFKFFGKEQSEEERLFIQAFPEAEIAALVISENVSLFGFAVIKNRQEDMDERWGGWRSLCPNLIFCIFRKCVPIIKT